MNKTEIINQITQLLQQLVMDEPKSNTTKEIDNQQTNTQSIDKTFVQDEVLNREESPVLSEPITPHQLEELEYELNGYPEICTSVCRRLGIGSLSDMEKSKYRTIINEIRRLKMLREGKCICKSRDVAIPQN